MQQVKTRREGNVGIIELDNPPDQFMTTRMVAELDELTEAWAVEPDVRAIVITGSKPGTFITHFSVEELSKAAQAAPLEELPRAIVRAVEGTIKSVDTTQRLLERMPAVRKKLEAVPNITLRTLFQMGQIHRVFSRLERMDKAVIAAINGTAMGGGCELALSCDYRLMARGDHVIGLIEVLGGIVPGAGGTQRLWQAVGKAKAVEMLLDGTVLSADDAERVGLVTRAVDADRLMDDALQLAHRMATRPLGAVGHAKRAVRVGTTLPIDDGLLYEKLAMTMLGSSRDAQKRAKHYLARFKEGTSARAIFDELRERGLGD